ncbi:YDG domain-containing protein, partial [Hyphomonas beringensis]|uniref:YDG domain-containing protein n=1 Tax=Hyphomonas beringensis TaxID=1280946 RepID=UPI000557A5E7
SVANRVYDGTADALDLLTLGTLVGVVADDIADVTIDETGILAEFADKNAGNGKPVTVSGYGLSGDEASNYTVKDPTGLTATITPKELTVDG